MKLYYLLIAAVCLVTQSSSAEEAIKYDAPCFNTTQLFNELAIKFNAVPIAAGITNDQVNSTMTLWINPSTTEWTIIATKEDTSCIIGTGVYFKVAPIRLGQPI